MSGDTRASALRALRDCGVIRVTRGQVPAGYMDLHRDGRLHARQAKDHPDKVDVRLRGAAREGGTDHV